MPVVVCYDGKGNKVVLQATERKGLYERLNSDGKGTGNVVNLKVAIQCGSLFTEEQHKAHLAKKARTAR